MKIHATFDLVGRRLLGFAIRDACAPDQKHAVDGAIGLGEGDLLIRDLGYFSVAALREILALGIKAITRLRLDVALLDPRNMDAIDLLPLLRSRSAIDMPVLVGKRQALPMRMVAFRLPKEIGQQRRRAFRRASARRGRSNPTKLALQLQDWQIYLTNCDESDLGCEEVRELYLQRWSVEILFKAFKSHGALERVPPFASEAMVQCLVLSSLIRITLTHTLLRPSLEERREGDEISDLKLHALCELLACLGSELPSDEALIVENILRHCMNENRSRMSLPQKLARLG